MIKGDYVFVIMWPNPMEDNLDVFAICSDIDKLNDCIRQYIDHFDLIHEVSNITIDKDSRINNKGVAILGDGKRYITFLIYAKRLNKMGFSQGINAIDFLDIVDNTFVFNNENMLLQLLDR